MMVIQASRYIRLTGKARMSIFSTTTVISRSKTMVKIRDTTPILSAVEDAGGWTNLLKVILAVTKKAMKQQTGTVSIAKMGGSFWIMAV